MQAQNLRRRFAGLLALASLTVVLSPQAANAGSFTEPDDPELVVLGYAHQLIHDDAAIAAARTQSAAVRARPVPDDLAGRRDYETAISDADYSYRTAIGTEQLHIFRAARHPELEDAIVAALTPSVGPPVRDAIDAYHSMWRLAGFDELHLLNLRRHPLAGSLPATTLHAFYIEAATQYQLDWTYLAAINYVESDFGRVAGTSSAGAQGPMQFMPATWEAYSLGGDINDPHSAILTAARYLFLSGGRKDMGRALYAYNHDWDYVDAVARYAALVRRDDAWLDRLYYWNTAD